MKPLILEHCIERETIPPVEYIYDANSGLNLVKLNDTLVPFITLYSYKNYKSATQEAATITNEAEVLELFTKTERARESDDAKDISLIELELLTKTKVERESDDRDMNFLNLEVETKTYTTREKDD